VITAKRQWQWWFKEKHKDSEHQQKGESQWTFGFNQFINKHFFFQQHNKILANPRTSIGKEQQPRHIWHG
jgi:hypothetical protein